MGAPRVQVLSRHGCCLCDEMKGLVGRLADAGLCAWEEIDIDADDRLRSMYGMDVPVVMINGRRAFKHRATETALRIRLNRERYLERNGC